MLNKTVFNQTKQDNAQIFEGILFFKTTNNTDSKIKTNHLAAVSRVLPEGCVRDWGMPDVVVVVVVVVVVTSSCSSSMTVQLVL